MTDAAQFAIDALNYGWHVIPVSDDKIPMIKEWTRRQIPARELRKYRRFSHVCGRQHDGTFIIGPEFDHKPEQAIDATEHYERFKAHVSNSIWQKLWVTRSTRGQGYHIRAIVSREVPSSIVRDDRGRKVGDLRSTGGHLLFQDRDKWLHGAPWTMAPLTDTETDELLAALNYRTPFTASGDTTIDWQQVAYWSKRIDDLLKDGLPDRFRPTCQGAHYLRNKIPANRSSDIRFAVIEELISYGYDDAQTAALALHLTDFGVSSRKGKGRTWFENDVARIIGKVREKGPRVRYKGKRVHQSEIPVESTGQAIKPHIQQFLYWLGGEAIGDRVLLSQSQIAERLNVSVRTVKRWEKEAAKLGRLERHVSRDRHIGFLVLSSGGDTPDDTQELNTATQAIPARAQGGVGGTGMALPENGTCTRQLVEQAIEQVTGLKSSKKRAAVVLGYVRAYQPDADPAEVTWLYERVTTWERQRRADERFVAKLRTMTDKQLATREKAAARNAQEAHARGSPGQAWVFGRMAWFCAREWERREPLRKVLRDPNLPLPLLEGVAE